MSGAMESLSGCQYIPIQSSASRWTNGWHVCSPQLSKANPLEEHKHLLTQRLEQSTKKRRPLGRKLREVLVIVLQDYQKSQSCKFKALRTLNTPYETLRSFVYSTRQMAGIILTPRGHGKWLADGQGRAALCWPDVGEWQHAPTGP
jgi:hypothetical protein